MDPGQWTLRPEELYVVCTEGGWEDGVVMEKKRGFQVVSTNFDMTFHPDWGGDR
jgi:hypothetical protein